MFGYTSGATMFPTSACTAGMSCGNQQFGLGHGYNAFIPQMTESAMMPGIHGSGFGSPAPAPQYDQFASRFAASAAPVANYGYGDGCRFGGFGSAPFGGAMPWQQPFAPRIAPHFGAGFVPGVRGYGYDFGNTVASDVNNFQTDAVQPNLAKDHQLGASFSDHPSTIAGRFTHQVMPQSLTQPFAWQFSNPVGYGTWPYITPSAGWGAAQSFQTPFAPGRLSGAPAVPSITPGQVPTWTDAAFATSQTQPLPNRLPAINIWEDETNLCVEAEVPGVSLDDVDLQIAGRTLHIRTGRLLSGNQSDQQRRLLHGERVPGGFSRVIELPTEIDGEKVEVKLNNGVLRLTLPKLNAQQRRTIRVNQVTTA